MRNTRRKGCFVALDHFIDDRQVIYYPSVETFIRAVSYPETVYEIKVSTDFCKV